MTTPAPGLEFPTPAPGVQPARLPALPDLSAPALPADTALQLASLRLGMVLCWGVGAWCLFSFLAVLSTLPLTLRTTLRPVFPLFAMTGLIGLFAYSLARHLHDQDAALLRYAARLAAGVRRTGSPGSALVAGVAQLRWIFIALLVMTVLFELTLTFDASQSRGAEAWWFVGKDYAVVVMLCGSLLVACHERLQQLVVLHGQPAGTVWLRLGQGARLIVIFGLLGMLLREMLSQIFAASNPQELIVPALALGALALVLGWLLALGYYGSERGRMLAVTAAQTALLVRGGNASAPPPEPTEKLRLWSSLLTVFAIPMGLALVLLVAWVAGPYTAYLSKHARIDADRLFEVVFFGAAVCAGLVHLFARRLRCEAAVLLDLHAELSRRLTAIELGTAPPLREEP